MEQSIANAEEEARTLRTTVPDIDEVGIDVYTEAINRINEQEAKIKSL